jgi:hypothetical protein
MLDAAEDTALPKPNYPAGYRPALTMSDTNCQRSRLRHRTSAFPRLHTAELARRSTSGEDLLKRSIPTNFPSSVTLAPAPHPGSLCLLAAADRLVKRWFSADAAAADPAFVVTVRGIRNGVNMTLHALNTPAEIIDAHGWWPRPARR